MLRDFEKSINQMESPFFHVFEEFEVFEKMEYWYDMNILYEINNAKQYSKSLSYFTLIHSV